MSESNHGDSPSGGRNHSHGEQSTTTNKGIYGLDNEFLRFIRSWSPPSFHSNEDRDRNRGRNRDSSRSNASFSSSQSPSSTTTSNGLNPSSMRDSSKNNTPQPSGNCTHTPYFFYSSSLYSPFSYYSRYCYHSYS